ncbi:MAG: hypothetical protein GY906_21705 [bacterium]|nr:hypothetical protein [bacterium]
MMKTEYGRGHTQSVVEACGVAFGYAVTGRRDRSGFDSDYAVTGEANW